MYKGHNIKQASKTHSVDFTHASSFAKISEELKNQVPEHIKEKAREMARQELQRRLEELNMKATEANNYGELLKAVQSHMLSLHDLLERACLCSRLHSCSTSLFFFLDLAAKEEERIWIKRQTDGELDDSRLTEGLTGEATVYKRRGMEKPELGRPQLK